MPVRASSAAAAAATTGGAAEATPAPETPATPAAAPAPAETIVGAAERHTFQAETKQLLQIVSNSLYTDKHVFIRELISNASDALEKLRHKTVAGAVGGGSEGGGDSGELAIRITTDEAAGTITIADNGIGMDKAELMDNLGTIARSGSKAFLQRLKTERDKAAGVTSAAAGDATAADLGANIIGQFGVGFYSAFMVSDKVQVFSRAADAEGGAGHAWTSAGDGAYDISPATGVSRGTKIVIHLREDSREFASAAKVRDVVLRYSSFVSFPIHLNGKVVNTVGAIWTKGKESVSEKEYADFYRFKSGDFEPPLYRLHFSADAPIALKALLFVGSSHEEKYGMGRIKPGVDLYSRRILIEAGSRIMPDWLRFVHGVVDSEDIPLNISRESMQDSALMKRLRTVLTRRVLRFLEGEARADGERYNKKFFTEFGTFLKEGAVTDATYAADIARLLRFESSALPAGQLTSFDEYVSRMGPGQSSIYYLVAPHRGIAESSPYMEAFRGTAAAAAATAAGTGTATGSGDVEVLYLYSPLDDFVMGNLREVNGRKLLTAEAAELDAAKVKGVDINKPAAGAEGEKAAEGGAAAAAATAGLTPLTEAQVGELGTWLQEALPKRLSKVRATTRLRTSPAVVTDHESAAVRRMMRMVEASSGRDSESLRSDVHMLPPQTLEVNPSHPVIIKLHGLRTTDERTAKLVAEQLLDNALVAAGLVDDSRTMLPRLNALLEAVVGAPRVSGYVDNATTASARWVSPKEADERAGVDAARSSTDAAMRKVASAAKADASAKAADSATGGADGSGFDMAELDKILKQAEALQAAADSSGAGAGAAKK